VKRPALSALLALLAWPRPAFPAVDLAADADELARQWQDKGRVATRLAPMFLEHGLPRAVRLPDGAFGGAIEGCTTIGFLAPRSADFIVRVDPVVTPKHHPTGGRIERSSAGVVMMSECGIGRASLARLSIELRAARAAVETVVALGEGSAPAVAAVLPERAGGPVAPFADPGPRSATEPLGVRVRHAEQRAHAAGAAGIKVQTFVADNDGSGHEVVRLEEGCHRVEVFADLLPKHPMDLDAEMRESSTERLLARDRSDAPDARLEFCAGSSMGADLAFAGAPGPVHVTLLDGFFLLPHGAPTMWGARARAGMAQAFFRHRVAPIESDPVAQRLGVAGLTSFPLPIEPGGCNGRHPRRAAPFGVERQGRQSRGVRFERRHRRGGERGVLLGRLRGGAVRRRGARQRGELGARAVRGRVPADRRRAVKMPSTIRVAALGVALASCRPPPSSVPTAPAVSAPTSVVADHLDGRRWLTHDAEVAVSLGAGPLLVAGADVGGEGDRVGGFVTIAPDQCALAYARGSLGVEDLDLYAYADDGTILAADEASDPQPAIVICPPHPSRAYVVARVVGGRGVVAVGVHSLGTNVAAQVGKALGARGRPGEELGRAEAWPGLDDKVNEHRRRIGAHWEEVRRVAVQADARAATRISAALDAGRCLDIYVVPGEEFAQLDVTIFDSDDRIVMRAAPFGRDRAAVLCSTVSMPISVELRPHAGQGLCAIVLARSAVGGEREVSGPVYVHRIAPDADLGIERAERGRKLRTLGYPEPALVGTGTADVGRRLSFPITLPDGCARVDVVGGRPLAGLTADIWDASNNLVASGASGDGATLFACGKGGHARIDLEALNRPGPVAIEVRRESTALPALVAHPLAASRLLSALHGRSDPVTAGAAASVKVLSLDPSSLRTFDIDIPDSRCGDIVAALDAGGSGLEMRLLDAPSGEEYALERGRLLAQGHVCATGRARSLRGELRLSAGKADALVVLRLSPIVPP
jgi:hypothetical protein